MLNVFAAHRTIHRVYFEREVRLSWFLLDELREKRSTRRFAIASNRLEVSRCNEKRFAAAVHGPKKRDARCSAMLERTSISLVAKSPINETFVRLYRVLSFSPLVPVGRNASNALIVVRYYCHRRIDYRQSEILFCRYSTNNLRKRDSSLSYAYP